ncbi:hypothetical protein JCM1840_006907 [Sporobolomyces johnsonii]
MSCFSWSIFRVPSARPPSPPPNSPRHRFDVARPAKLVRRSSLRPLHTRPEGEPWLPPLEGHLELAAHDEADEEALKARIAERERAEWERIYARGLYDLQHPPPPPPSLPSAPSQLNPPFYNPPYAPPPAPDESLRQRTVDKLDLPPSASSEDVLIKA